jgi:circadian clock protein KaiB
MKNVCFESWRKKNLRKKQEKESGLEEEFKLEIIDIMEHPELAEEEMVIAIPQLVQKSSLPPFRIIGNLSDKRKILRTLGIDNTVEG